MQSKDLPTTSDNTDEWQWLMDALDAHAELYARATMRYIKSELTEDQRDKEFHHSDLKTLHAIQGRFQAQERKYASEVQAMLAKLLEEGRRMYTSPGVTRMSFFAVPSQVIEAELNHLTTEKKQP